MLCLGGGGGGGGLPTQPINCKEKCCREMMEPAIRMQILHAESWELLSCCTMSLSGSMPQFMVG